MIEYWHGTKMYFTLSHDEELGLVATPNLAEIEQFSERCMWGFCEASQEIYRDMLAIKNILGLEGKGAAMLHLCGGTERGSITVNGVRRMYVEEVMA